MSRYLLEINGRYDGSSRFAKKHRWGFFPSVSVGWNVTEEKFMEPISKVLSHLKLRASIGRLGNQAGAALYTFASNMSLSSSLGNYFFSDGRHTYLTAPSVVNPSTTWEKVNSENLGVDFGFFNNALNGSFDIYQRTTKDMLGPGVDFPDFFGASAPQTNNASMRNRGWELTLNYSGKIANLIDYTIGGSVSDAKSVVTDYANPTGTDPANNWYTGKNVGEIWGYRTDGLIKTQEEADEYNKTHQNSYLTSIAWTPGDVAFRDLNGDGKVNSGSNVLGDMGDRVVVGNTTPRYQYTFNGSVSWKGLSLSLFFQGVGKRDWDPTGSVYFWGSGAYAQVTVFKEHMDFWSEDNPNAYYPKPYINTAGAVGSYNAKTSRNTTDQYLQNAAYCRLKNLTISYILPKDWVNKLKLEQVKVFFSGENLLTFTKLKGMFDPEEIFTGSDYSSEGGKNYPLTKVVSFGISINL
jgi:TonB-linked SusC/RagA family outer membrane protein